MADEFLSCYATNSKQNVNKMTQLQPNPFAAIFDLKPLDRSESNQIDKILADGFQPGKISEEQVTHDALELKNLSSEIKSIGRQSVVLTAERAYRAREILKPYRDGTFTRWLEKTFGTRRTGHNLLAYYEFYRNLSADAQEKFKKIPQRTAYLLASRVGDIEVKAEIVQDYQGQPHEEIVKVMQAKLPPSHGDKRVAKDFITKRIDKLEELIDELIEKKQQLSDEHKTDLFVLKSRLETIL